MEAFLKAKGFKGASLRTFAANDSATATATEVQLALHLPRQDDPMTGEADLAWHVRAWGRWVLVQGARKELASHYPTYAEWSPLDSPWPQPSPARSMGDDSATPTSGFWYGADFLPPERRAVPCRTASRSNGCGCWNRTPSSKPTPGC